MSEQQQGMSEGELVLWRARRIMQNKGYGWSKAVALAAESIKREPTTTTTATKAK